MGGDGGAGMAVTGRASRTAARATARSASGERGAQRAAGCRNGAERRAWQRRQGQHGRRRAQTDGGQWRDSRPSCPRAFCARRAGRCACERGGARRRGARATRRSSVARAACGAGSVPLGTSTAAGGGAATIGRRGGDRQGRDGGVAARVRGCEVRRGGAAVRAGCRSDGCCAAAGEAGTPADASRGERGRASPATAVPSAPGHPPSSLACQVLSSAAMPPPFEARPLVTPNPVRWGLSTVSPVGS